MSSLAPASLPASTAARRASLGVLLAAFISGLYWLPLRGVQQAGVADLWAAVLIALPAVLVLLPLLLLPANRPRAGDLGSLLLVAGTIGAAFSCYTASLILTDVVHALLLFYIAPAWSTLLEVCVLRRRLTVRRVAALVLAFAGLWAILGGGDSLPLPRNVGDWMALASGLLWAVGTLIAFRRPALSTLQQTLALGLGALATSLLLALLGLAGEFPASPALGAATPWLLPLALLLTLPMWFLTLWGVKTLSPTRTTLIFMLEVCIGVASAAILTDEPFGWSEGLGMLLVLAAAGVELLEPRKPVGE